MRKQRITNNTVDLKKYRKLKWILVSFGFNKNNVNILINNIIGFRSILINKILNFIYDFKLTRCRIIFS